MKSNTAHKTVIAAVAVLAALALPMVAGAADTNTPKLVVKDSTGVTDRLVVTDKGYVGVGTSVPLGPIDIISNGITQTSAGLTIAHTTPGATPSASTAPNFSLYRNNTVDAGNNGNLRAGDRLGTFVFGSYVYPVSGASVLQRRGYLIFSAASNWTEASQSTQLDFYTSNVLSTNLAMRIANTGNVGIGTSAPKSKLHVVGIPVYANNAAAITGGLTAGAFYRTGADPDVLCIVH
jgi:hypothetical protein